MVNTLDYLNQIVESAKSTNIQELIQALVIIFAQTLGLWLGYLFTEWVHGKDPDEDMDNELEK